MNIKNINPAKGGVYKNFLKRLIDFFLSLIAIIVLSPVFIIVALLVRVKLGSPVLFKQKRPGLNEKLFTMYKFRTMTSETDENGKLLPDSFRLTNFGSVLRTTSIDELPELFNILKGDMSIVGPRPLLEKYLSYYTDTEKVRHLVRPGLTGLAQVNGRNMLGWDTRLGLDVEYVQRINFILDLHIVLRTIVKTVKREDITVVDQATLQDLHVQRSEKNAYK